MVLNTRELRGGNQTRVKDIRAEKTITRRNRGRKSRAKQTRGRQQGKHRRSSDHATWNNTRRLEIKPWRLKKLQTKPHSTRKNPNHDTLFGNMVDSTAPFFVFCRYMCFSLFLMLAVGCDITPSNGLSVLYCTRCNKLTLLEQLTWPMLPSTCLFQSWFFFVHVEHQLLASMIRSEVTFHTSGNIMCLELAFHHHYVSSSRAAIPTCGWLCKEINVRK